MSQFENNPSFSKSTCPYTGELCGAVDDTQVYIKNMYTPPFNRDEKVVRAITSVALRCGGLTSMCTVPSFERLDRTIQFFNDELSPQNPDAKLDERAVELAVKVADPIDRALMWTDLLPVAINDWLNPLFKNQLSGLLELTRLRDVFHDFYGGFLDYPDSGAELKIFNDLALISRTYMRTCTDEDSLTIAADDVSEKFAKRYMKVNDVKNKSLHDEVRSSIKDFRISLIMKEKNNE